MVKGQHRKNKPTVSAQVNRGVADWIKTESEKEGVKQSEIIRRLLRLAIEKQEVDK